jgi:hypothetical protein
MPRQRKTWSEKLDDAKGLPKIGRVVGRLSKRWGNGMMVVPAPREVDELMRRVRRGHVATIDDFRIALAKKHGVDIACPLTTGIFAWIAAHAAAENEAAGRKRVTPWWRTLKAGGELNAKYPGGVAEQARRLRAEGHRVVRKGRRWLVENGRR